MRPHVLSFQKLWLIAVPSLFLSKPLLANLAKLNVGQYLCPWCKVNATQYEWAPYFLLCKPMLNLLLIK